MAHFTVIDDGTFSPGTLQSENHLEFGGLNVDYVPRRNRFLLSSPHNPNCGVILFEADIPAFLAFVLSRFKPFDKRVAPAPECTEEVKNLRIALCLAWRVFIDVRGWTSRYCTDCMAQRDRASTTQHFITRTINGDIERILVEQDGNSWAAARILADEVQSFVAQERERRRRESR
jgi:hypothetical protein